MPNSRTPVDAGFTMLEMVVAMAIAGSLAAISVSGWQGWTRASEQDVFADQLKLVMRQAQQLAVARGGPVCVDFDLPQDSWTVVAAECGTPGSSIDGRRTAPPGLDLVDAAFSYDVTGPRRDGVTFYSDGSATQGELFVHREDGARIEISVKKLTGRVSIKRV